jgi:3-oxoacyl-[acyl-carrier-protein] synthase-3
LADAAINGCLRDAGLPPGEVELLINAGLYRDSILSEPALAALIQEDVGMNPEDPHADGHGTFSFDIANGACGVLTALQVLDGFVRAGTISHGLVVTSDADPGHHLAPRFPFAPAGAAVLCTDAAEGLGLDAFRWATSPDDGELFRATVHHEGHRNVLAFHIDPDISDQLATLAAKVATEVLTATSLSADTISVAVVAPSDASFVSSFASLTGIDGDRVIAAPVTGLHTVAFPSALDAAVMGGRLLPGTTALFVSAGAGLTAGACLYRS